MAKVVTSDKLHDFLMNPKSRPDLQTPEGQAWLAHLDRAHQYTEGKIDPLTPWLTREWKKGRLRPEEGRIGRMYYTNPDDHPSEPYSTEHIDTRHLNHWVDFLNSNHPIRRQMGDIMQHKVWDVDDAVDKWDQAMKEQARAKELAGGQVVHTTPDNWTIRKLTTPEELKAEGDVMAHCVGSYGTAVRDGRSLIYSLRDPKGLPHATTEIRPDEEAGFTVDPDWLEKRLPLLNDPEHRQSPKLFDRVLTPDHPETMAADARTYKDWLETRVSDPNRYPKDDPAVAAQMKNGRAVYNYLQGLAPIGEYGPQRGRIVQIQGKGNKVPIPDHQARLKDWFTTFPESERPNWEEPEPITHIDDLSDDGDEPDSGYTPHGDYGLATRMAPIDYAQVIPSLVRHEYQGYRDPEPYDQDDIDALYNAAATRNELPQLSKAYQYWNENDVDTHVNDILDHNDDQLDYPGQDWEEDPDRWQRIADTIGGTPEKAHEAALEAYYSDEAELMRQSGLYQTSEALGEKLAPFHEQQARQRQQQPQSPASPPQTFSHVRIAALYKRWAFDPASGNTRVSDNDGDPLEVAYHGDLAKSINRPGTIHGYAYALPDGWRITDQDSKSVNDPYVLSSIMRALSA